MDVQETSNFIEVVYKTFNISHTWFIYKNEEECDISALIDTLKAQDYPLFVLTEESIHRICDLEQHYRFFVIEQDIVPIVLQAKILDMSNISVILCTTPQVLNSVSRMLHHIPTSCLSKLPEDLLLLC